jgi:hypothetical protein
MGEQPVSNYPSQRSWRYGKPIAEPFEGQGEPGWRPGLDDPADGAQFITDALIALGWNEHGAREWSAELLRRYPYLCTDDYRAVAEVADMLYATVADPHDWDDVGAVLNVLEWRWRTA